MAPGGTICGGAGGFGGWIDADTGLDAAGWPTGGPPTAALYRAASFCSSAWLTNGLTAASFGTAVDGSTSAM